MTLSHMALAVMLMAQGGDMVKGRDITLHLPHPPAPGESIWLKLKVGEIGRSQLHVTTPDGRELGTIGTYGVKAGRAAGVYMLPIPPDVAVRGHLTVRLTVLSGYTARAATRQEVPEVRLSMHRDAK